MKKKKEFFLIQSSACDKLDSYDLRHMNFYERIKNFPWIRSDIEYLQTRAMFLYKVFVFVLSHDEIVIDTVWIFCEKMKASIYVEAAEASKFDYHQRAVLQSELEMDLCYINCLRFFPWK